MGYSLAWVAVRGTDRDRVLAALGASPTGERQDIPDADLVGASLPSGFYLVVANHFGVLEDEELARDLSLNGEALLCFVEEHVMMSMACCFVKGRERWRITHESEAGREHLAATGELPASYASVRDAQLEVQRRKGGADYVFDVPLLVAKSITGFRHDGDIEGAGPEPFEVLELA